MRNLIVLALAALTLGTTSCGKIFTHANYQRAKQRGPYDAVIVPGFPFHPEAKKLNTIYKIRLYWAYHLYKTGMARNIIFSGGAVHTPFVEAEILAAYAKQLGIPEEHIHIEAKAEHSTENLFYGLEVARAKGYRKVALATDPFQNEMIRYLTKQDQLQVEYVPAVVGMIANRYWNTFDLKIDASHAQVENFVPLKDRISKEERKRGTAGDRYRDRMRLASANSGLFLLNGLD